ncbi:MAG: prepilin-type N-terminal cleavage/methylation domain-containing protein [Verrucomicrobiales bacterium]|nr:prepilin-type N-terminal cleavage/methylation domain-containing protein [Verrucomicrobiales bacterium]
MRSHSLKGFTLIELMVVVTIIAVLSLIGFSGAGQFIMMSKRAKCASNLRQIGVALQLYATNNNGRFPMTSHTTGTSIEKAWVYQLEEYLGEGFDSIRVSPGDPKSDQRIEAGGTSYILNSFLFVPEYDPFGNLTSEPYNMPALIPRPTQTMLAFTIAEETPVGAQNDHTHSNRWTNWRSVLEDISPDLHRTGEPNTDHTDGSSNYLFADGHVETWDADQLKAQIEAGENPAYPPEK